MRSRAERCGCSPTRSWSIAWPASPRARSRAGTSRPRPAAATARARSCTAAPPPSPWRRPRRRAPGGACSWKRAETPPPPLGRWPRCSRPRGPSSPASRRARAVTASTRSPLAPDPTAITRRTSPCSWPSCWNGSTRGTARPRLPRARSPSTSSWPRPPPRPRPTPPPVAEPGTPSGRARLLGAGRAARRVAQRVKRPALERHHRLQVRVEADAVAGPRERAHPHPPVHDAQPRPPLVAHVEVPVVAQRRGPLARRAVGEAADVVVPVTLHVRDAERPHRGQILLKRHDRHVGEVLRAHEEARGLRPGRVLPLDEGAVEERLHDALAVLGRHPAVAERDRAAERFQVAVALVDDDRHRAAEDLEPVCRGRVERDGPVERLLDERGRPPQTRQGGRGPQRFHEGRELV